MKKLIYPILGGLGILGACASPRNQYTDTAKYFSNDLGITPIQSFEPQEKPIFIQAANGDPPKPPYITGIFEDIPDIYGTDNRIDIDKLMQENSGKLEKDSLPGIPTPQEQDKLSYYITLAWYSRYVLTCGGVAVDNDVLQPQGGVIISDSLLEGDSFIPYLYGDFNMKQQEMDEIDFGVVYMTPICDIMNLQLDYAYFHLPGFPELSDLHWARGRLTANTPLNPGIEAETYWGDDAGNMYGIILSDSLSLDEKSSLLFEANMKINDHFYSDETSLSHASIKSGIQTLLTDNLTLYLGLNYMHPFDRDITDNEFWQEIGLTYSF
jgi:hypothetical protein